MVKQVLGLFPSFIWQFEDVQLVVVTFVTKHVVKTWGKVKAVLNIHFVITVILTAVL